MLWRPPTHSLIQSVYIHTAMWSNISILMVPEFPLSVGFRRFFLTKNGVMVSVLGRPFVKRFALCYQSVVLSIGPVHLSVCPVCDIHALWPNGWTDQDETWHAGRPRPWPHCVRWRPSSPSPKGAQPPNFRPISVVAKWLHGSRCRLVWSSASAQPTLC